MTRAAPIDVSTLGAGFADPVHDAQAAFRGLMDALARPGRAVRLPVAIDPPAGLAPATLLTLLTLADVETPLHLPADLPRAAVDTLRFHTGAPVVADPGRALFALTDAAGVAQLLPRLGIGEDRYPDRSATLLVELPSLDGGLPVRLTGPGIPGAATVAPVGLDRAAWAAIADNAALYPLGVDLFLVAGDQVMGLPRSTMVGEVG